MILNGKHISEDARLKLLADEEHAALGLDLEYRSGNAIQSMRVQMHPATTAMVRTLPGEAEPTPSKAAQGSLAATNSLPADEGCFSAGAGAEVLT